MNGWVSDEMVKRAVARLPRHYGLSTVVEDGALQVSNPHAVIVTMETGVRGVAMRHRALCSANKVGVLRTIVNQRLHCRHQTGKHFVAELRQKKAEIKRARKQRNRERVRLNLESALD